MTQIYSDRYRRDIDGLRAIAILSVILFHCGLRAFSGGFVGVDIFFVISGYLIGGIVFREVADRQFTFTAFYARRARRILPALIFVALITIVLGLALLSPAELSRFAQSMVAAMLGGANIWFWLGGNYFLPDARLDPFLMTWSLGVEEQFYVILPILLLVVHRVRRTATLPFLALIMLASLLTSALLTTAYPKAAFYLLPTRLWELGAGTLLGIAPSKFGRFRRGSLRECASCVGLLALVAAILLFNGHTPFPGFAALLPVAGTVVLIATEESFINRRLLARRPMVGIGLLSYSWYLWHWPLMAFARICAGVEPTSPLLLTVAGIALFLAYLSWRYVETPFRRQYRPLPGTGSIHRYACALLGCLAVPLAIWAANGLPGRVGANGQAIDALLAEGRNDACLAPYGVRSPNRAAICLPRDDRSKVALLGDSHAAALGATMRATAAKHGAGFVQLTKSSCPPLLGVTLYLPARPAHAAECADFNKHAADAIASNSTIGTIALAAFWSEPFGSEGRAARDRYADTGSSTSDDAAPGQFLLRRGLIAMAAFLTAHGKRVLILGDVPEFLFDPARQAFVPLMPMRHAVQALVDPAFVSPAAETAPRDFVLRSTRGSDTDIRGATLAVPGATFAPLARALCRDGACRFSADGRPLYLDSQHLSGIGAAYALSSLDQLIWQSAQAYPASAGGPEVRKAAAHTFLPARDAAHNRHGVPDRAAPPKVSAHPHRGFAAADVRCSSAAPSSCRPPRPPTRAPPVYEYAGA